MPAPIPPGLSTRTVHDFRAVGLRAFVPVSTYDEGESVLILEGEDGSTLAVHFAHELGGQILDEDVVAGFARARAKGASLTSKRLRDGDSVWDDDEPSSEDRVRPFIEDRTERPRCEKDQPCSPHEGACECTAALGAHKVPSVVAAAVSFFRSDFRPCVLSQQAFADHLGISLELVQILENGDPDDWPRLARLIEEQTRS